MTSPSRPATAGPVPSGVPSGAASGVASGAGAGPFEACPVCDAPVAGDRSCPDCGWVLVDEPVLGPASPALRSEHARRLAAARTLRYLDVAVRAAGFPGREDTARLAALTARLPLAPEALRDALGRTLTAALDEARRRAGTEPASPRDDAGSHVVRLAESLPVPTGLETGPHGGTSTAMLVHLDPDGGSAVRLTVDRVGSPGAQVAAQWTWPDLAPSLAGLDEPERAMVAAGGLAPARSVRREVEEALRRVGRGDPPAPLAPLLDGAAGRHLLLMTHPGWWLPERFLRAYRDAVPAPAIVERHDVRPTAFGPQVVEDWLASVRLRTGYALMLATTADGRVALRPQLLFPAGVSAGTLTPPEATAPPDGGGVRRTVELVGTFTRGLPCVLAVVALPSDGGSGRDGEPSRLRPVWTGRSRLAPGGRYRLDARLLRPGALRIRLTPAISARGSTDGDGPGEPVHVMDEPDLNVYRLALEATPERYEPPAAADIVCAVELSGGPEEVGRRVRLLAELVAAAHDAAGDPEVCTIRAVGYTEHTGPGDVVRPLPLSPAELAALAGRAVAPVGRVAALEDALQRIARLPRRAGATHTLVVIGSRPPHPTRTEASDVQACPHRIDWRRQVTALRGSGTRVVAVWDKPDWARGGMWGDHAQRTHRDWGDLARGRLHIAGTVDAARLVRIAGVRASRTGTGLLFPLVAGPAAVADERSDR